MDINKMAAEQESEQARIGKQLGEILGMRRLPNGRWFTEHGDKTDLGLFRTLERIGEEIKGNEIESFLKNS